VCRRPDGIRVRPSAGRRLRILERPRRSMSIPVVSDAWVACVLSRIGPGYIKRVWSLFGVKAFGCVSSSHSGSNITPGHPFAWWPIIFGYPCSECLATSLPII
jgi:hypothetical protein